MHLQKKHHLVRNIMESAEGSSMELLKHGSGVCKMDKKCSGINFC